jgi:hypothetical protein
MRHLLKDPCVFPWPSRGDIGLNPGVPIFVAHNMIWVIEGCPLIVPCPVQELRPEINRGVFFHRYAFIEERPMDMRAFGRCKRKNVPT